MASSSVKYDPLLGKVRSADENVDELKKRINALQTQMNVLADSMKSTVKSDDMQEISDADINTVFSNS